MGEETPVVGSLLNEVNSSLLETDEGLASLHLFGEYSDSLLDFGAAACIIFMLVGIPGNLITIISLARYKKIRNATAIFIINMSFADLLFGIINLPLSASTFLKRAWVYGVFMCKFFVFARIMLAGVTLFTVLAITTNRYILISYPQLYPKLYTDRSLGIFVAATWIIPIVSLIPTCVGVYGRFGMDLESSFCIIQEDENGRSPMKSLFISSFIIPFITITFCYARIFWIVRKTNKKLGRKTQIIHRPDSSFASNSAEKSPSCESATNEQTNAPEHPRIQSLRPPSTTVSHVVSVPFEGEDRSKSLASIFNIGNFNLKKSRLLNRAAPTSKDKRLLTMISAIMITFFVFHLPITIIKACHEVVDAQPTMILWSYLLRYFTTCVNPIIYVVMSYEYRKAYNYAMVMPKCEGNLCIFWR